MISMIGKHQFSNEVTGPATCCTVRPSNEPRHISVYARVHLIRVIDKSDDAKVVNGCPEAWNINA